MNSKDLKMEFSVPIPSQTPLTGSFSNKWYEFVNSFQSQDFNRQSKKSFLLHYGSQTINEINVKNKISNEEFTRWLEFLETVEHQCLYQIVLCFLRHLFFSHCRRGSSLEEFYGELRFLSEWCSFEEGNRDDLVKKQLISNIHDESVRDVFLSIDNLTAANVLDVCNLADRLCIKITPDLVNAYLTEKQQQTLQTNSTVTNTRKDFGLSTDFFLQTHETEVTKDLNITSLAERVSDAVCVDVSDLKRSLPLTVTDFAAEQTKNDFSIFAICSETTDHIDVWDSKRPAKDLVSTSEMTILQPNESKFCASFTSNSVCEPTTTSCVRPFQDTQHLQELIMSAESESLKDESKQSISNEGVLDVGNNNTPNSIIATSGCENNEAETDGNVLMPEVTQDVSTTGSCDEVDDNNINNNHDDHVSIKQDILQDSTDPSYLSQCYVSEVPSIFISKQSAFFKISPPNGLSRQVLEVYACNLCKFTSTEKINIEQHALDIHSSLNCYICTSCNSKFPSKYQIESHVRHQHVNVAEPKCHICNRVCTDQMGLLKHFQTHSQLSKLSRRIVSCEDCGATFSSTKLLLKHFSDVCSLKRNWICLVCKAPFSTRTTLSDHISEAHPDGKCDDIRSKKKSKRFMCRSCDIHFSDIESKRSHRKKFHKKNKNKPLVFACDRCDYKCISKCYLLYHQRTHTGEKPYVCEICGKGFAQATSLVYHLRTHTGEKPYKCQYCDVSFSTPSNRLKHERDHRQERPFICEQCGKGFRNGYELRSHIENHNEVKRFSCFCGSAFNTRGKLILHKKYHLPRTTHTCNTCGAGFTESRYLRKHQQSQACSNRVTELRRKAQKVLRVKGSAPNP